MAREVIKHLVHFLEFSGDHGKPCHELIKALFAHGFMLFSFLITIVGDVIKLLNSSQVSFFLQNTYRRKGYKLPHHVTTNNAWREVGGKETKNLSLQSQ